MHKKLGQNFQDSFFHRWQLLILMGTASLGCSFVYDIPQALQTQFQSPPTNFDYFKFDMLYSVYSIPNIILPLLGGYLTKILGVKLGLIIFVLIVLQGEIVFSIGVFWNDYATMIVGRVLYAFGSESLYIAQFAMAVKWFSKKELTFVLGWNNSVTYFANVINGFVTPMIYNYAMNLWVPSAFGALLCGLSLFCALRLAFLMKPERETLRVTTTRATVTATGGNQSSFSFKDLKQISLLFWAVFLYYIVSFPIYKGFTANMNDQVHRRFGFTNIAAGKLGFLYYVQLMMLSPFVGMLTDRHGKRMYWLLAAGVLLVMGHLMFISTETASSENFFVMIPLILLGAGHAIFEVTSWSAMYLALSEQTVEIGFGIASAGMNAVTVAVLMGLGRIEDATRQVYFGYYYSEVFLVILAGASLALLLIVGLIDRCFGKKLGNKEPEQEEDEKSKKYLEDIGQSEEQQGFLAQDDDESRDLFFL